MLLRRLKWLLGSKGRWLIYIRYLNRGIGLLLNRCLIVTLPLLYVIAKLSIRLIIYRVVVMTWKRHLTLGIIIGKMV